MYALEMIIFFDFKQIVPDLFLYKSLHNNFSQYTYFLVSFIG